MITMLAIPRSVFGSLNKKGSNLLKRITSNHFIVHQQGHGNQIIIENCFNIFPQIIINNQH